MGGGGAKTHTTNWDVNDNDGVYTTEWGPTQTFRKDSAATTGVD